MNSERLLAKTQFPWGALFWAVPVVYMFWDPYQENAGWVEWVLTSLAFVTFIALYVTGIANFYNKERLRKVCIGVLLLGIGFLAYRPTGAMFFPLVAAFSPFTVDGNIPKSAAIIGGVVGLFLLECWLLTSGGAFPVTFAFIFSAETILISAGTTFVARQNRVVERIHRVTERERIARDLHDVLGHTLSSIALKSELAGRLFHKNPERAFAEISDVERISRQALEEVRQAIHGYHAGDIQSEFERTQSMLEAAGIEVEQSLDSKDIGAAQERVLALVLREAATNVVRHAHAKRCRLSLQQSNNVCRLEVRDDGRGEKLEEGLGIRSIRTRVEALGGSAVWSHELGTQLTVTLPMAATA